MLLESELATNIESSVIVIPFLIPCLGTPPQLVSRRNLNIPLGELPGRRDLQAEPAELALRAGA